MRTESMKGKECLYGRFLNNPTPDICQHETEFCQDCQIYLDFKSGNHRKNYSDLLKEVNRMISRGEL
jgi:hypothetical protein